MSRSSFIPAMALLVPFALAGGISGCAHKKPSADTQAASDKQQGSEAGTAYMGGSSKKSASATSSGGQQQLITSQKSLPEEIVVNNFMTPKTDHQFLAEVRTADAVDSEVLLRVDGTPVEVEMQNIGGNTWRGNLSPDQLGQLAIAGKSVKHQAHVIVKDPDGRTIVSKEPLKFSVSAPSIEKRVG